MRFGLCEGASESREFVRMCSATNGGRISAAVSGKFAFHASRSLARLFEGKKEVPGTNQAGGIQLVRAHVT